MKIPVCWFMVWRQSSWYVFPMCTDTHAFLALKRALAWRDLFLFHFIFRSHLHGGWLYSWLQSENICRSSTLDQKNKRLSWYEFFGTILHRSQSNTKVCSPHPSVSKQLSFGWCCPLSKEEMKIKPYRMRFTCTWSEGTFTLNARQITMSLLLQCSQGRSAGEGGGGTVVYLFISLATNQKLPSTRTPACLSISALGRWVAARQKSREMIKQEGGTDVRAIGEGKEKKKAPTTRGRDVRDIERERVVISECGRGCREERWMNGVRKAPRE